MYQLYHIFLNFCKSGILFQICKRLEDGVPQIIWYNVYTADVRKEQDGSEFGYAIYALAERYGTLYN
jgi:hypothetical protein